MAAAQAFPEGGGGGPRYVLSRGCRLKAPGILAVVVVLGALIVMPAGGCVRVKGFDGAVLLVEPADREDNGAGKIDRTEDGA